MSRIFSNLKTHFLNWRQWELNPVVVKELRQAVRSWAVTATLLLFLLVLLCAAVVFFVTQSFEVTTNQRLGADIFTTFSVILTGASLFFIPLYVGVRVANERQESDLDLLYISTLTPKRIIRGKFFCGAYVAVLFFSACMPFMTFTNLLRGVDLPSVFFALVCLFLAVCCSVQVAIFLACLPISKVLKILVGLGAAFASCWLVIGLTFWTSQMMQRGVGSMMSDRTFWAGFLTVCGVIFIGHIIALLSFGRADFPIVRQPCVARPDLYDHRLDLERRALPVVGEQAKRRASNASLGDHQLRNLWSLARRRSKQSGYTQRACPPNRPRTNAKTDAGFSLL